MTKEDIEEYKILYFQNGYRVPYKLKCGETLYIYPIKVKDWGIFEPSLSILKIEKNKINNIEIIKMSYLQYLVDVIFQKEEIYKNMFANVLLLSINEDRLSIIKENNKPVILISDNNNTVKFKITSKEFDDISKIILFYNIVNYDDRYVDDDVQTLMEEYYKIKYKNSKYPTLEEQKTYVMSRTGMSMQDINDMDYRSFSQVFEHSVNDVIYLGNKIIQASYKYSSPKDDIVHPLYTIPKDKYAEIFEDTTVLNGKGISGAEQLNMLNNK